MHTVATLLVIVGAVLLIGVGVVSLIHDLLGRGPHDAPLIEDDGLSWPPRYQGVDSHPQSAAEHAGIDVDALHGSRR